MTSLMQFYVGVYLNYRTLRPTSWLMMIPQRSKRLAHIPSFTTNSVRMDVPLLFDMLMCSFLKRFDMKLPRLCKRSGMTRLIVLLWWTSHREFFPVVCQICIATDTCVSETWASSSNLRVGFWTMSPSSWMRCSQNSLRSRRYSKNNLVSKNGKPWLKNDDKIAWAFSDRQKLKHPPGPITQAPWLSSSLNSHLLLEAHSFPEKSSVGLLRRSTTF